MSKTTSLDISRLFQYVGAEVKIHIASESSKLIRKAIQAAYNMDYDTYREIFNLVDDGYVFEKWRQSQDMFNVWYCSLDEENAMKFMEYVLRDKEGKGE